MYRCSNLLQQAFTKPLQIKNVTHTHTHTHTQARMHARTHARTHARAPALPKHARHSHSTDTSTADLQRLAAHFSITVVVIANWLQSVYAVSCFVRYTNDTEDAETRNVRSAVSEYSHLIIIISSFMCHFSKLEHIVHYKA